MLRPNGHTENCCTIPACFDESGSPSYNRRELRIASSYLAWPSSILSNFQRVETITRCQVLSGQASTESIGFKRWGIWLSWLPAAFLTYLAWQVDTPILFALLAGALYWGSSHFRITPAWQYRLAFLVSAALAVLYWLSSNLGSSQPISFAHLGLAVCSALATGMLISGWQEGFWEDNNPPSRLIQEEVFHRHQAVIGAPDKTDPGKRIFDIFLSAVGLLLTLPLWVLIMVLVWLEDPGPVLFIKNSVGKGGVNFRQFKFRTMVRGAESDTGPVASENGDTRVLEFGRLLRKTALDELPQLINILIGEMSFVGPRPQRTVLVREYLEAIPDYAQRHRVMPGLSGLAQVAGDYFLTPRQKLRYDRIYVRHANLGFDVQLIFLAFLLVFWYRWKKDWDGRLPRGWIRLRRRKR